MRAQVVLLDGDRILLARHLRGHHQFWVLPGGEVEPDETPEAAAIRELREEAGLDVQIERLLFVENPSDGPIPPRGPRYTYLATVCSGALHSRGEPERAHPLKGYLAGVEWRPLGDDAFDMGTRHTLERVRTALQI